MSKKHKKIRAKLIVNPGAGKASETNKELEQVTRCLLSQGIQVDVSLAHPKKVATKIAQQAVKDDYKMIVAMGGDGTIEAVMRGMVGSKARLGIIPAGTANNIAKSLGIPEDLEEACKMISSDQTRKLDVGQLKSKKAEGKGRNFYFMEVVAIGLTAALYPDTTKIPKGNLASIKDAAATLLHYDSKPKVVLTLDDDSEVEVETMLVVVSNTPVWGLNFLVAPNASLEDSLFDVAVFPDFSKAELLAYFTKVMNQKPTSDDRIQRYRARKIKIKAKPKLDIMADGVMIGKGTVRMKILPHALKVIAPPPNTGLALTPKEAEEGLPAPVVPAEPVINNP